MVKPKYLIFSGAFGFVASFLIAIISTHRFGRSLLRGLIFGISFAVLFFLMDLLMKKFLGVEDSTDGGSSQSSGSQPAVGSKVDISLNDENLSDNGENLKFFVANNKHQLEKDHRTVIKTSAEPASATASSSTASESSSSSFQPINLNMGQQLDQFPGGDNSAPKARQAEDSGFSGGSVSPMKTAPSAVSDIDSLPDIGGLGEDLSDISSGSYSSDDSGGSVSGMGGMGGMESDFSSGGSSYSSYSGSSSDKPVPSGDTELIAKAISTALKRDE